MAHWSALPHFSRNLLSLAGYAWQRVRSRAFRHRLVTVINARAPGRERMPLHSAFPAAVRAVFGDTPLAAIAIQSAVDAGTCVLVFKLGAMLGPRVGLLAGALAAAWPNLITSVPACIAIWVSHQRTSGSTMS